MFTEKDFEDIICEYPELIEDGLKLVGRQKVMYSRRIDILFQDKFSRKLLIELKKGPIKDEHIGQLLSYEGMILSADDPTIRIMLVGNRVPPNIQRSLDHHGIAWKELKQSFLHNFFIEKNNLRMAELFDEKEFSTIDKKINNSKKENNLVEIEKRKIVAMKLDYHSLETLQERNDKIIKSMISEKCYQDVQKILDRKRQNEASAKKFLQDNVGNLKKHHLIKIFELVDEPYLPEYDKRP